MSFVALISKVGKLAAFPVEYFQDMWLYLRRNGHSPIAPSNDRLFYHAVIQTHTIEKGLSLPRPRPLFGKDKIRSVASMLKRYDAYTSAFPVEMAHGAFRDYRRLHQGSEHQDALLNEIDVVLDVSTVAMSGGVKPATPAWADAPGARSFLTSRESCRVFAADVLETSLLEEAVRVAQAAPSQCNRQATKVHLYQDKADIQALLKLQGGATGFSDGVSNLFVVTSDMTAWGGAQQRNQLYVDGGLFSMNLMLGLHALGLASCPLNLAVTNAVERRIRAAGAIPGNERLIMMVATGRRGDGDVRVARSPRRSSSEILLIH